jgi:SWI/SNF-related matrix-associated actin-dependent regulator of chromatin subfamily A member 5
MAAMLASAVESCTNSWWQLELTYTGGKGRIYTQEEDQFILCMTHQIGYGNWDRLKQEIRRSWQFRFDWFLKSRTPQELSRRCDTLIKMLEKVPLPFHYS